jgi:hypothetical protein
MNLRSIVHLSLRLIICCCILALVKAPVVYSFPEPPDNSRLIFADDFELGLSQWQLTRGKIDYWQVTSENRLEAAIPHPHTITELVPLSSLWQRDWRNYRIEFDFQAFSNADINWSWGFEDVNNWYELHFYGRHVHLVRLKDGQVVFSHSQEYSLPRRVQRRAVIIFDQGRVQAWFGGELIIDQQDQSYEQNGGRISLKATTGAAYPTRIQFGAIRVYDLHDDSPFLPLTDFKQYDEAWRNEEYDHALDWKRWGNWRLISPDQPPEQVSIYHWGCAMTSLAMVMRFHHLNRLPNGAELNPSSLNEWLRREADGYVGQGSINWLAGSRLSRLISNTYSSSQKTLPKLEYFRHHSNPQTYLQDMIDAGRPGIIQIPGHFLVGQGYIQTGPDQADYYISDPAYSHRLFSQHDQPMVSLVDFRPTNTDLSYLMVLHSPDTTLELFDHAASEPFELSLSRDSLVNPFYEYDGCLEQALYPGFLYACAHHQSAQLSSYFPQPKSGSYLLSAAGSSSGIEQLRIFFYDRQAEVKMIDRYLSFDAQNSSLQSIVINYDKDNLILSTVSQPREIEFQPFFSQLRDLYLQQHIPAKLYLALSEISNWTEDIPNDTARDRYQQLILRYLFESTDQLAPQILADLVSLISP